MCVYIKLCDRICISLFGISYTDKMTRAFIIVNMALGAVLVVVVIVVIAFTIILVVMWRGKKAISEVIM